MKDHQTLYGLLFMWSELLPHLIRRFYAKRDTDFRLLKFNVTLVMFNPMTSNWQI